MPKIHGHRIQNSNLDAIDMARDSFEAYNCQLLRFWGCPNRRVLDSRRPLYGDRVYIRRLKIDQLAKLGLNQWFRDQIEELDIPKTLLARVSVVNRDQYILRDGDGDFVAVVTPKFIRSLDSTADLPCVGDWVCVKHSNPPEPSVITVVLSRQSFLRRKALKKKAEFQMIAANINTVFIVEGANLEFNLERLERYITMAKEGGVEPVLILTKIDLISEAALEEVIAEIRKAEINIEIISISNKTGENVEKVHEHMYPQKTYCLVGSSGVGKTTLTKSFIEDEKIKESLKTNTVSKNKEGRHTTVRRELVILNNEAMLIDTPGMRGLTVEKIVEDVSPDLHDLAAQCRFSDCAHGKEPGCAVLKAVKSGELSESDYKSFVSANKKPKISYAEQRNKGKGKKK